MVQKIRTLIMSAALLFAFATPVMLPASASAVNIQQNVCSGSKNLTIGEGANAAPSNPQDCSSNTGSVNTLVSTILNIFSVVVGLIAVVMIIVAGFKYITSGGKDESVKGAKNTILYAIIGLVIVGLAQIIVQFVLSKTPSS